MDAKQTIQEKLLQTLKDMILGPLKKHQEAVDKFKAKINESGNVLHTLEWNTSSTMKSAHVLGMMDKVAQYLETDKIKDISDQIDIVKDELVHANNMATHFLEEGGFEPSSSSASHNMSKIAKGKACGEIMSICSMAIARIEKL